VTGKAKDKKFIKFAVFFNKNNLKGNMDKHSKLYQRRP
jgi:hypothetical protein